MALPRPVAFAGRIVLWAAVGLLLVRGAIDIVDADDGDGRQTIVAGDGDDGLDVGGAEAFAVRFTADYLSVDETAPDARREALASYLADGVDLDGGWDGRGVQAVLEAVPMSITAADEDHPVVSVAARLAGGRWINLAVPLATNGDGFAVTGLPALIPAPVAASDLNAGELEEDPDLTGQLRSTVESFFRAYGAGSPAELDRWLAPGERLEGLEGAFELDGVDRLAVAEDDDDDHAIARATVRWTDAATGIALGSTYDLTLVQQEGRWYVERLGALGA